LEAVEGGKNSIIQIAESPGIHEEINFRFLMMKREVKKPSVTLQNRQEPERKLISLFKADGQNSSQ